MFCTQYAFLPAFLRFVQNVWKANAGIFFLVYSACMNFFSLNFPLHEFFFCTSSCFLGGKCSYYIQSWRGRSNWGSYFWTENWCFSFPGTQEINWLCRTSRFSSHDSIASENDKNHHVRYFTPFFRALKGGRSGTVVRNHKISLCLSKFRSSDINIAFPFRRCCHRHREFIFLEYPTPTSSSPTAQKGTYSRANLPEYG